ncbi:hypothetical protein [Acidicapsa acidisoli]|uniref:hypothetical protein n=1 Tax=Acidicapsa acidisoli TaxID=1615681 RepID=UPI0021DF5D9F|nr:hypothetical protein [Acidicapsa acidisoli]
MSPVNSANRLEAAIERLLPFASGLVPRRDRADWVKEWRAELWHRRHGDRRVWRERGALQDAASLVYGLAADAAWLRVDRVREAVLGSAYSCLWVLAAYCLLCAAMERAVEDSWAAFFHLLTAHFFGGFVLVAAPAIFAAVATYPLRPLRCNRQHPGARGFLSTRAKWNLFLAAKGMLTLALSFLATLVATGLVRMLVGRYSDWFELGMYALVVTIGMRWALLNQEQRCQKCLRMLSQPTRVGNPSHNFLEWSGTELACADGHGLLHVAEMQGSWCWYDLWVERDLEFDPGWSGLFSSSGS